MKSARLFLGGLTIEGFFDRGQVLLTLLRDGQVVARVPRDLYLGCFALTVETGGNRWTLEADGPFRSWRRVGQEVEGTPLKGWFLAARGTRAEVAGQRVRGFLVGVAAYFAVAALWSLWSPPDQWILTGILALVSLAVYDVYLVRQLRKHLDRQTGLVVSV